MLSEQVRAPLAPGGHYTMGFTSSEYFLDFGVNEHYPRILGK